MYIYCVVFNLQLIPWGSLPMRTTTWLCAHLVPARGIWRTVIWISSCCPWEGLSCMSHKTS